MAVKISPGAVLAVGGILAGLGLVVLRPKKAHAGTLLSTKASYDAGYAIGKDGTDIQTAQGREPTNVNDKSFWAGYTDGYLVWKNTHLPSNPNPTPGPNPTTKPMSTTASYNAGYGIGKKGTDVQTATGLEPGNANDASFWTGYTDGYLVWKKAQNGAPVDTNPPSPRPTDASAIAYGGTVSVRVLGSGGAATQEVVEGFAYMLEVTTTNNSHRADGAAVAATGSLLVTGIVTGSVPQTDAPMKAGGVLVSQLGFTVPHLGRSAGKYNDTITAALFFPDRTQVQGVLNVSILPQANATGGPPTQPPPANKPAPVYAGNLVLATKEQGTGQQNFTEGIDYTLRMLITNKSTYGPGGPNSEPAPASVTLKATGVPPPAGVPGDHYASLNPGETYEVDLPFTVPLTGLPKDTAYTGSIMLSMVWDDGSATLAELPYNVHGSQVSTAPGGGWTTPAVPPNYRTVTLTGDPSIDLRVATEYAFLMGLDVQGTYVFFKQYGRLPMTPNELANLRLIPDLG